MEDGWCGNPHYDDEWSSDAPGWPGESEINNYNDGRENSDAWYKKDDKRDLNIE